MLEIREAGIEDISIIQQLAQDTWPDAYLFIIGEAQLHYMLDLIYSTEALTKQITELQHCFVVLYDDGVPVGFASSSPKNSADKELYRLHKLYVLPNQQGKGTGRFLLDHVIDSIKKEGATSLELNVNRQNKACEFYKKLGFEISHEVDLDIGEGYFMNDYIMVKQLDQTSS